MPVLPSRRFSLRTAILLLLIEKTIQHLLVTVAFILNWGDIRSTVVPDPRLLTALGGIVAILFAFAAWAFITRRTWATTLIILLAVFDILGEFAAQGTAAITLTVSFLVASVLLVLTIIYVRRRDKP